MQCSQNFLLLHLHRLRSVEHQILISFHEGICTYVYLYLIYDILCINKSESVDPYY